MELFSAYGIGCKRGPVISSATELESVLGGVTYPVMVKAQVAAGGRGKAGGIRYCADEAQAKLAASEILGMKIKGKTVEKLMLTPAANIEREMYLAITLDRASKCPVVLYCAEGGMEIEAHPEKVKKVAVNPEVGLRDFHTRYLDPSKEFYALVSKLYKLFCDYDALLCEINPLIPADGGYIAIDGKITVDDSALKRHPDLAEYAASFPKSARELEAEKYNFLYIPCDDSGDLAVMSNGSGMLMSCIDAIAARGRSVRATLDLGGGATAERIREAVRIMTSDSAVKALFINIFGGITRCDEVAGGIREALTEHGVSTPVVVRFEGTNKDKGLEILAGLDGVTYVDGLSSGVEAVIAL